MFFKCESIFFLCSLVEVFAAATFSLLLTHSPGLYLISYLWWNSEVVSESKYLPMLWGLSLPSSVHLSRLCIRVLDQDIGSWCWQCQDFLGVVWVVYHSFIWICRGEILQLLENLEADLVSFLLLWSVSCEAWIKRIRKCLWNYLSLCLLLRWGGIAAHRIWVEQKKSGGGKKVWLCAVKVK